MRFRHNAGKFTGDIGESWKVYVAEYQQLSQDYYLDNRQELQYFHNIMGGDVKRFHLNNVLTHVNAFNHAVKLSGSK